MNELWKSDKYYKRAIRNLGLNQFLLKEKISTYDAFLKYVGDYERKIEICELNLETAHRNIKICTGNVKIINENIVFCNARLEEDDCKYNNALTKEYKDKIQEYGYELQDMTDALISCKDDIATLPSHIIAFKEFVELFDGVEPQMKNERHKELQKGIKIKTEYL